MKAGFTIGEIARELQLNPRTIRYYEEVGLLPEPRRSESGYRLYSEDMMEYLRLVRRAKLLDLSLAQIKEIVNYAIAGHCDILEDRLLALVKAKLGEIDQKIRDLVTFRDDLRRYHRDLLCRLKSQAREKRKILTSASCQCVGKEVDNLRKGTNV